MPDTAQKTAGPATEPETAPETRTEEAPPEAPTASGPSPAPPRPDDRAAAVKSPRSGRFTKVTGSGKSTESPACTDSPEPAAAEVPAPTRGSTRRLRAALRRVPSWWPLPLVLALGAGAGAVYSGTVPPQYAAVSYVVVSPAGPRADPATALGYAQAYGRVTIDPMVVGRAERRTGLRPGSIADDVRASTSPDAPMVEITATSPSPAHAARNADAVADALSDTADASARDTGVRLIVVSDAEEPSAPVSPSAVITTAAGACAGGLLGGLIVLVRRRPTPDVPDSPADRAS